MRGHGTTPPRHLLPLLLACVLAAASWGAQSLEVSRCEWIYSEDRDGNESSVCVPASSVAPLRLEAYQAAAEKGNLAARITSKFSALALWQGGGFYYAMPLAEGGIQMGCPPFDSFPSESDNTLYNQLELAECDNGAGINGLKLSEAMACQYVDGSCNDACGCVTVPWYDWEGSPPICVPKKLYAQPVYDSYMNVTLELETNFTAEQAGECAQYATPEACNAQCACAFTSRSNCVPKALLSAGLSEEQLQMASDVSAIWADEAVWLNWGATDLPDEVVGCCKNRAVLNAILDMGPGRVPGMTYEMRKAYTAEEAFCNGFKASEEECLSPLADLADELIQTWAESASAKADVNCTNPNA